MRKTIRCKHCNKQISMLAGKGNWIHYPVREGEYKGIRFFGCHYYDPTLPYTFGDTEHNKQATPPEGDFEC